jgi:hypothetical protein
VDCNVVISNLALCLHLLIERLLFGGDPSCSAEDERPAKEEILNYDYSVPAAGGERYDHTCTCTLCMCFMPL